MKKAGEASRKETSWVPDPVTGYYRPENIAKEMDAAEMRAALIKNKIRRKKETSWVPDPVTGYYRPENMAKEMDAAEMRAALLNNKIRRN
nr:protein SENESCENCE-ASSOCIATED GENE 21, mitochondrial-like [Ipomoea batatas]